MKDIIRVAQVRAVPQKGDLEENFRTLQAILDELDDASFDVLITPECFLDGYIVTEASVTAADLGQYAIDPHHSPYVDALSEWARRRSVWAVFGCTRIAPEGCYNTALIFDRTGALVDCYDKTHLMGEDTKYALGQRLPVFASDFGPFGVMICADRRWPETVRTLALKGARVIFNPTYGMHDERNLYIVRCRSYESEIAIAFTHPEQSLVTAPNGDVICNERGDTPRYSIAEIDLTQADALRRSPGGSHLTTRRPDLYAL
jgi:predicted amidohydrolase